MIRDFYDDAGERWTMAPGKTRFACFIVSTRGEQIELYATRGAETITLDNFRHHVRVVRMREAARLEDEAADQARWAALFAEGREESAPAERTVKRDRRGRVADESAPKWRQPNAPRSPESRP